MARFARNRPTRFTPLEQLSGAKREEVGSLAEELLWCLAQRIPVAKTWVLPAGVHRQIVEHELPRGHDPSSLLKLIDRPRGIEQAARAYDRLFRAPLPLLMAADLAEFWEAHGRHYPQGILVRSSPTLPAVLAHNAGLLNTWRPIQSPTELSNAIRHAWASAYFEGSLRFLKSQRVRELAMPIIIQLLPATEITGELITREPPLASSRRPGANNYPEEIRFVSYQRGFRPSQVRHDSSVQLLQFDVDGNVLQRSAQSQPNEPRAVSPSAPAAELSQKQVSSLAALANRLSAAPISAPNVVKQIQFTLTEEGPIVYGAAEATRLAQLPSGEANSIWSLASLGEVLPSIPTPLTWSVATSALQTGFNQSFRQANLKPPRQALLTRVDGRVYFNVSSFFEIASQFPTLHTKSLLEIMGGPESDAIIPKNAKAPGLARMPWLLAKLMAAQRVLGERVKRFEEQAEQQRLWLVEMDLAILPDDGLKTTLAETHGFFRRTSELLLSCAALSLVSYVALKTVLHRRFPEQAETIAQTITSGLGGLDTLSPASVLSRAQGSLPSRNQLASSGEGGEAQPNLSWNTRVKELLSELTERGHFEADLASPRWNEQPEELISVLQQLSEQKSYSVDQRTLAVQARAKAELRRVEERVPYLEFQLIKNLLLRYQRFLRLRERARIWLARTSNMMRSVVMDAERRFLRLDRDFPRGGIFYLSYGELRSALASVRADLGPIAALRQAEYQSQLSRPDPPRLFIGSPPLIRTPQKPRTVLRGLPGGPGIATGRARLIDIQRDRKKPLHFEHGDILVARAADLGLLPELLLASALVVELGGPLSHLALAARELDVPCVVSVSDALRSLKEGELLRVDGTRGIVERLQT